ncbi:PqqD family protein [Streptomyces sp. NPDC004230]
METEHWPRRVMGTRAYRSRGSTILVQRIDRYRTNEAGGYIWSLCDEAHTAADISRAVALRYGIVPDHAAQVVASFLTQLQTRGFLHPQATR